MRKLPIVYKTRTWLGLLAAPMLSNCSGDSVTEPAAQATEALGASNPPIVIRQVYGGGGNTSAPFKNDFVELFNRSGAPVTMSDWSVQYASASGTGTFLQNGAIAVNATLAPGQYLLVSLAGSTTGASLPPADVSGSINLSATAGKLVLVDSPTGLACNGGSTPCSAAELASIIDLVGYGGSNFFEGSAATPSASNTMGLARKNSGCVDTNDNAADFALAPPTPHNSASPAGSCAGGSSAPTIVSTAPADGSSGVATSESLVITFSEPVTLADNWYSVSCSTTGVVAGTVTGGYTTYTIALNAPLTQGETCTVVISSAGVKDLDAGLGLASDSVFSFATELPLTAIHTIQGAAHLSPLAGTSVRTSGIVTGVRSNGYYLQDPTPDADPTTSEGIFVFTSAAPTVQVGDAVDTTGKVAEFRPGCASSCSTTSSAYSHLTTTEITAPSTRIRSSSNLLPQPTVIGLGGRVPPNTVIENDASGSVETAGVFDPDEDGIDFYESLEGMRVQINDAVAVGPTSLFGTTSRELSIIADNGASASLRTARGGLVVRGSDFNPERLVLANDIISLLPDANVGDSFPGAIIGVIDYNFANYRLVATEPLPALRDGALAREILSFPPTTPADLDIAAFNVENLDPTDPPEKFGKLASIVVQNLKSPDILTLEEVQDNSGPVNDGVVDASQTLRLLTDAIASAGGPTYEYRSIDPVNNQDGGEPGGNIRVAFLFRTDRGLLFVDRAGASGATPNSVIVASGQPALQYSPGRIDPTNTAFTTSRKPLAGEFRFNGAPLFVIANHFNSKGGDQPLFGRFQPPALSSQVQRESQARIVADFVGQILAADVNANVAVLGDLNDFEFSAPITILKNVGLTALIETLPPEERYTYVFQGNSQTLDHALLSSHLLARNAGFDVVHVNAEFADQASDHDPSVTRLTLDDIAPVVKGPGDLVREAEGPGGATVTFDLAASDQQYGDLPAVCSPSSGTLFPLGTTNVVCSATDRQGNVGRTQFDVTVRDTTPPLLQYVPASAAAWATHRDGGVVSYALPSASDAVSGALEATCTPASGAFFPLGQTPVSCASVDAVGNQSTAQFIATVTVSAPPGAHLFRRPIHDDGGSIFKLGRVIPVKFALTGPSAGITDLPAKLYASQVGNGITGEFLETESVGKADTGNTFRYDSASGHYIYNLSTKAPPFTEGTWVLRVDLGDGVPHEVAISLRR